MNSLTDIDFLQELLVEEPDQVESRYPRPTQNGPFRFFDSEMRCASRGCGSPTRYKLQGIPYCSVHCLNRMNDMLIAMGVEK